jgi:hypothetical protein
MFGGLLAELVAGAGGAVVVVVVDKFVAGSVDCVVLVGAVEVLSEGPVVTAS